MWGKARFWLGFNEETGTSGRWTTGMPREGSMEGAFKTPQGITVSPDNLVYVNDTGNSRIQTFLIAGSSLNGWLGQYFKNHIADGWTKAGSDYLTSTNGKDDGAFTFGESSGLLRIDNKLFVLDGEPKEGSARLQAFDTITGRIIAGEGITLPKTNFPEQFKLAYSEALDNFFVLDVRNGLVMAYDRTFLPLDQFGNRKGSGQYQFSNPLGFYVSGNNLFITDTDNSRIVRLLFFPPWPTIK